MPAKTSVAFRFVNGQPGPGLVATLTFADGTSVKFSQAEATDMGDYVGQFVHQRCFMQRKGDWVVWFRPDADGKRDEVIVERGTFYRFIDFDPKNPSRPTIATVSGSVPSHFGIPPAPVITIATGSPAQQHGVLVLYTSYATPKGDTTASYGVIASFAAGQRPTIKSPPPFPGATGWNVHAVLQPPMVIAQLQKQNVAPIPFGTNWTAPDTGIILGATNVSTAYPQTVAYTLTVSGGTLAAPVAISVPHHEWAAGFRWFSSPRKAVRGLAELQAMKIIPPMDKKFARLPVPSPTRPWAGPMDTTPLVPGMPTTGGRVDIGPFTDWAAAYLMTGDVNSEQSMRNVGEAAHSMPFWFRDVETGALIDLSRRKLPSWQDAYGDKRYQIPLPAGGLAGPIHFILDTSHMPSTGLIPYLVYDDPFYLECAQAEASFNIMWSNGNARQKFPCAANIGQPRSVAWGWRTMFQLAIATPETTPTWLLNRSYWRDKVVPDQKSLGLLYKNNPSRVLQTFHNFTNTASHNAFMVDYLTWEFGWIMWTREFPEMDDLLVWLSFPLLAIHDVDNSYGWDHRAAGVGYLPIIDGLLGAAAKGAPELVYNIDDAHSVNAPASWGELFEKTWKAKASSAFFYAPPPWPVDNVIYTREAHYPARRSALAMLALASKAGVPGLDKAHAAQAWLWSKISVTAPYGAGSEGWCWAVDPDA